MKDKKYCVVYVIEENKKYKNIVHRKADYKNTFIDKISCIMNIPKDELHIGKGLFGKPFFQYHKEIQFNISYTTAAWAFVISSEEVGIDIEKIRKCKEEIINRFYSPEEIEYINFDRGQRNERFYEIWTRKEAYAKCTGRGLTHDILNTNMLNTKLSEKMHIYRIQDFIISVYAPVDKIDIHVGII